MRRVGLNTLGWTGLAVAAAGWALLVLGEDAAQRLPAWWSERDLQDHAGLIVLTGFGLAILGALQNGFAALNRFFDKVLQGMTPAKDAPSDALPAGGRSAQKQPIEAEADDLPSYGPAIPARARGVDGYVVRPDGTTEVETVLGVRRFATVAEAQEFLRA